MQAEGRITNTKQIFFCSQDEQDETTAAMA
jgi:hypothetical protein